MTKGQFDKIIGELREKFVESAEAVRREDWARFYELEHEISGAMFLLQMMAPDLQSFHAIRDISRTLREHSELVANYIRLSSPCGQA